MSLNPSPVTQAAAHLVLKVSDSIVFILTLAEREKQS